MASEAIPMSTVDLSGLKWRKSSRSGQSSNGNCVEVALTGPVFAMRDSKNPTAGALTFPMTSWTCLLHRNRY